MKTRFSWIPFLLVCLSSMADPSHTKTTRDGERAEETPLTDAEALKIFCTDPHRAICSSGATEDEKSQEFGDLARLEFQLRNSVATQIAEQYCKQGIEITEEDLYDIPRSLFVSSNAKGTAAAFQKTKEKEPEKKEPEKKEDEEGKKCTGRRKRADLVKGEVYKAYLNLLYKTLLESIDLPKDLIESIRASVEKRVTDSKKFEATAINRLKKGAITYATSGDAVYALADPKRKVEGDGPPPAGAVLENFQASCSQSGLSNNAFHLRSVNAVVLCPGFLMKLAVRSSRARPFPIRKALFCYYTGHESGHAADFGASPASYDDFFACLQANHNAADGRPSRSAKALADTFGHEITADYWGAQALSDCLSAERNRTKLLESFREAFETQCDAVADSNQEDEGAHNHPEGKYRIVLSVQPFREKMGCPVSKTNPRCSLGGTETK